MPINRNIINRGSAAAFCLSLIATASTASAQQAAMPVDSIEALLDSAEARMAPAAVASPEPEPQSTPDGDATRLHDSIATDAAAVESPQPPPRPTPSGDSGIDTTIPPPPESHMGQTPPGIMIDSVLDLRDSVGWIPANNDTGDQVEEAMAPPPEPVDDRTPTTRGKPYGDVTFVKGSRPRIVIETNLGTMVFELLPEAALQHCQSMVHLARSGFYDSLTFHRVIPGFLVQGGSPTGGGDGGPGYTIPAEFGGRRHEFGSLSMARSQNVNSAGSQFFLCLDRAPHLDGQFSAFGRLVEGDGTLRAIGEVETDESDRPVEHVIMTRVYVRNDEPASPSEAATEELPQAEAGDESAAPDPESETEAPPIEP